MNRFAFLSLLALPLVACTMGGERHSSGECPAGEVCSPKTPSGLLFIGTELAGELFSPALGPAATAIGGTQEIELQYEGPNGDDIALDLPYDADDDGGLGVEVAGTAGAVVTVRGVGSRENYLRIVDQGTNELFDRHKVAGAAVSMIEAVGTQYEQLPTGRTGIVWALGTQEIGVALSGEVQVGNSPTLQRLVDTSMQISLPSAEQVAWDTLRVTNPLVGVHTLLVKAGDKPSAELDIEFVAGADTILVQGDPTPLVPPGGSTMVCFAAMNNSRYVYGLEWQYNVNGVGFTRGQDATTRNCITVTAPAGVIGSIPVSAAAGGQQISMTVTIGATARARTERVVTAGSALLRTESPLGERAALAQ
jgi:hypothetical protein